MEKNKVLYLIVDSPLIEYTTIIPDKLCELDDWPNSTPEPSFRILLEKQELIEMFRDDRLFEPEKVKNSASYIYLILYNARLEDIKYRFHSVILLGETQPNTMQIYQISTREFYWSTLNFQLYDENGEGVQSEVIKWI